MNRTQRVILSVGVVVAALMVLFPPYFDTGGLFGGVQFGFALRPPVSNYAIDIRPALAVEALLLELIAVACFTLAALLAKEDGRNRAALWKVNILAFFAAAFAGAFLAFSAAVPGRGWTAAPFLLCLIPVQFPGGYFLYWLRLAALGTLCLMAALATEPRSGSRPMTSIALAMVTAAFEIVTMIAIKAALL